jgi:hypothetical protein
MKFCVRLARGQGWAVPKDFEIVCRYHDPNQLKKSIEDDTLQILVSEKNDPVMDALRFFLDTVFSRDNDWVRPIFKISGTDTLIIIPKRKSLG